MLNKSIHLIFPSQELADQFSGEMSQYVSLVVAVGVAERNRWKYFAVNPKESFRQYLNNKYPVTFLSSVDVSTDEVLKTFHDLLDNGFVEIDFEKVSKLPPVPDTEKGKEVKLKIRYKRQEIC